MLDHAKRLGTPPDTLRRSHEISAALTLGWLELFQRQAKGDGR